MISRLGPFIHVVRFILLILVQVMIVNNIDLGSNVYPMIYVLFLLLLPIETPPWLAMIIAFVYGAGVDAFHQHDGHSHLRVRVPGRLTSDSSADSGTAGRL